MAPVPSGTQMIRHHSSCTWNLLFSSFGSLAESENTGKTHILTTLNHLHWRPQCQYECSSMSVVPCLVLSYFVTLGYSFYLFLLVESYLVFMPNLGEVFIALGHQNKCFSLLCSLLSLVLLFTHYCIAQQMSIFLLDCEHF